MIFIATPPASAMVDGIDEVDVAGPGGDDEHLADADDHGEGREGEAPRSCTSPAALAAR